MSVSLPIPDATPKVSSLCRDLIAALCRSGCGLSRKLWESSYSHACLFAAVSVPHCIRIYRWFVSNYWSFLKGTLVASKFVEAIQTIYKFVKNLLFPDVGPKGFKPTEGSNVAESTVAGSREIELPHGKGEVLVMGSDKLVVGKGCRIYNVLVVPEHVVHAAKKSSSREGVIISNVDGKREYDITGFDYEILACDVVGYELPADVWSGLGVGKIDIGIIDGPRQSTITGVQGKGTSARIDNNFGLGFGSVHYLGTTCAGYSGATYRDGSKAIAIHLNGGAQNNGVATDLIRAKIVKSGIFTVPESLDTDWSMEWVKQNLFSDDGSRRRGIRVSPEGLDEVKIFYKGRYHVFDKEQMSRGLGSAQYASLMYEDAEAVFQRRPNYGASNMSSNDNQSKPAANLSGTGESCNQLQNLATALSQPMSKNQLKKLKWLKSLPKGQRQLLLEE